MTENMNMIGENPEKVREAEIIVGTPSYNEVDTISNVTFSAENKHMDVAKAFLEPREVLTFPLIEEPFEVLSILAHCR